MGVADGIDVTLENAAVEFAEATVVHAKEVLDDLLTEDVDELSAGTSELAEKLGVADGIDITLENAEYGVRFGLGDPRQRSTRRTTDG